MLFANQVIYPNQAVDQAVSDVFSLFAGLGIVSILLCILQLVGSCKVYMKAGKPFWAAIIPFYSTYVLFQIVYGEDKGWKFLTLLIPFYNIYVSIKLYLDLSKAFGQSIGFGLGLIFLYGIFICILGFGPFVYQKSRGSGITDADRMAALNRLREKRG